MVAKTHGTGPVGNRLRMLAFLKRWRTGEVPR
jgi:hypothetical protein